MDTFQKKRIQNRTSLAMQIYDVYVGKPILGGGHGLW